MGIRNRFRLDLTLIYRLLETIPSGSISVPQIRGCFPDLGGEKLRGVVEWSEDLGLTSRREQALLLSPLGKLASLAKDSPLESKVHEIMYYKLATSHDLEVLTILVNNYLWEVGKTFGQQFHIEEAKRRILELVRTQANARYVRGEVSTAINILTSEKGLGRLGMVVPISKDHYRVNPYRPDWRTAAYILYDSWPTNVARVRVAEVVGAQDSLGRIFFLSEPQVMALLSKLEQEHAIALEAVADLSQIGLNPALKAEDFLEMLAHEGR